MIKHTAIHLSAWHDGRLVGFARAITDTIYRAVIDDVVVDTAHRGRGIGSQLMNRLGAELSDVEEVFFGCDTSEVPFYEKHGYEQAHHPYMKRLKSIQWGLTPIVRYLSYGPLTSSPRGN